MTGYAHDSPPGGRKPWTRARRHAVLALLCVLSVNTGLLGLSALCVSVAHAQQQPKSTAKKRPASKAAGSSRSAVSQREARRAKPAKKRAEAVRKSGGATASSARSTPGKVNASGSPAASTAESSPAVVHTEGDTQVKVMEFRGLDIEGQLKTPQMLYFLNRMRAEFGRPRLPHRSFMPELSRSTQERVF